MSIADDSPERYVQPPLAWESTRSSGGDRFWHDGAGNKLYKEGEGRRKSFVIVDAQGRTVRDPVEIVGARHRDGQRMDERVFVPEYNKRENSTSRTVRHNVNRGELGRYNMETDKRRYEDRKPPTRYSVDPSHTRTYLPDHLYR
ncbi:MAG: hypothetical protein EOO40_04050 [Deltaproteobacteria bacterium]|nr:MAG: hypothetical protein EOO40_04050 [Deltaproteobacteria bacterium]